MNRMVAFKAGHAHDRKTGHFLRLGVVTIFLAAILSCRLIEEERGPRTFSFDGMYEALKSFDRVDILIADSLKSDSITIFSDQVNSQDDLKRIPVPGYNGNVAIIIIKGFNKDSLAYQVEKIFDGRSKETLKTQYVRMPGTRLEFDIQTLDLLEGESIDLPSIKISPKEFGEEDLEWISTDHSRARISGSKITGVSKGSLELVARLKLDTVHSARVLITVRRDPSAPEMFEIQPESLTLAAGGALKRLTVSVRPTGANELVNWHLADTSVASISQSGWVKGKTRGTTWVWGESKAKVNLRDSTFIRVSDPVKVTGVKFIQDSTILFINGVAESLFVVVEPPDADQSVEYLIEGEEKVSISSGRMKGVEPGLATVRAVSLVDGSKSAILRVNVLAAQQVDSVVAGPQTNRLYTNGKSLTLYATVYGATFSKLVQWRSNNPDIARVDASGKIYPVSSGITRILAVSQADSTKRDSVDVVVKMDIPTLDVGPDTLLAPGDTIHIYPVISQEYGRIIRFKWDFDGDGEWDGESPEPRPISNVFATAGNFSAEFLVEDEEGNIQRDFRAIVVTTSKVKLQVLSPSRDTIVNRTPITIRYKLNESIRTQVQGLKDGLNTLRISDSLPGLGSAQAFLRVTLDSVPPIVRFLSPLADQSFRSRSMSVSWTVDNVEQDSQLVETLGESEGQHVLSRTAYDAAGNKGTASITVILDTKPPLVKITSPPDGFLTRNKIIPIEWSVDGTTQKTDTLEVLHEGGQQVVRRGADLAGNRDSATVQLTLDTKPPSIRILSPSDGSVTANSRVTVLWTVDNVPQTIDTLTDLSEGLNEIIRVARDSAGNEDTARVKVSLNTKVPIVEITSPLPGAATNQNSLIVSWKVNGVSQPSTMESLPFEGENTILRTYKDSLGLEGSASIKVIRDTQPPKAPSVSAAVGLINSQNPTSSAVWNWNSGGDNEGGSGIPTTNSYRLQVNGNSPEIVTAATWTLKLPGEGLQTLRVQQIDRAGNWSPFSDTVVIRVDRIPPAQPKILARNPTSSPNWTWLGAEDGNGRFRYKLDAASTYKETRLTSYMLHEFSGSEHTLRVQEADEAGNWSADAAVTVVMDHRYPNLPPTEFQFTSCQEPGPVNDTVPSGKDSQGFFSIFDGESLKGWWNDCKTSHTNGNSSAIWGVDTGTQSLYTRQAVDFSGGLLVTNKMFGNYEIIMDVWVGYGNDGGIFHRTTNTGRCYNSDLDFIPGNSIGGAFGEGGFESLNLDPFSVSSSTTIQAKPIWTAYTSTQFPTSFGCSEGGCVSSDWPNLWNPEGWNQFRIEVFGSAPRVRTYLRKFGSPRWVPLQDHQSNNSSQPTGPIGINVHKASGRWSSNPTWYRNIRVRELDESGNPAMSP